MHYIRILAMLTLCIACSAPALAQGLTGKTIRLVIPFGPGGPVDLLARTFASELGTALGGSMIVENRGGAGATLGTAQVAKAAPDGTTLLLASTSHSLNPSLYSKLAYHPLNDFVAVAHTATSGYILLTNAALPAKSVGEFISYARANSGKLNYSTAGIGSAGHIGMAYLVGLAGLDMVMVPFKSSSEAVNDVVAGRSHATIASGVLAFAKDERVRFLGVTSTARSRFTPELATLNESGLPGYEFSAWFGMLAPAQTPREIVTRLHTELNQVLKDPVVVERITKIGLEVATMSQEAFSTFLREDLERMTKVIKTAGVKSE